MERKHFVLIHGAFHGKWIWDKFTPLLKDYGHDVIAVDLDPRHIETMASADLYTKPLLDALCQIPGEKNVILVGHGFGGISAAIAMDQFPRKVDRAVFLNAFMPDTANRPSYVIKKYMETFHDWEDCDFGSYNINNGAISTIKLGPTFVCDRLFQHSPVEDFVYAMVRTRIGTFFPEPLAKRGEFTEQCYGSIPRDFITSNQDKAIPPSFQQWEIDNFPGTKVHPLLEADHMAMYSNPNGLLNILLEIAMEPMTAERSA